MKMSDWERREHVKLLYDIVELVEQICDYSRNADLDGREQADIDRVKAQIAVLLRGEMP